MASEPRDEGDEDAGAALGATLPPSLAAGGQTLPPSISPVPRAISGEEGIAETLDAAAVAAAIGDRASAAIAAVVRAGADYPVAHWDRYEFLGKLGQGGM